MKVIKEDMDQSLKEESLEDQKDLEEVKEEKVFKFGHSGTYVSKKAVMIPLKMGDQYRKRSVVEA